MTRITVGGLQNLQNMTTQQKRKELEDKWLDLYAANCIATDIMMSEDLNFNPIYTSIREFQKRTGDKAIKALKQKAATTRRAHKSSRTRRKLPWWKDKDMQYSLWCIATWVGWTVVLFSTTMPPWSIPITISLSIILTREGTKRFIKSVM